MDRPEVIGACIRKLRYRRGLTQVQLAFRAGVGEKTLKRLEAGRTGAPHPETLAAVAGALGLTPAELFAEAEAEAGEHPHETAAPAVHQLPRPPQNFTGRARELAELHAQLDTGGISISGIQGMGGIGKTALALVIAERWSDRFPDGQFYLDLQGATDPITPTEAMLHVIRSIDPARPAPKTEAETAAAYRSTLRGLRALLLMDNAAGREQVEPLLPPEGCVMLVTSRQRFVLPGLHALALAPLPIAESRSLIDTLAPHAAAVGEELAGLCGGLPLALSLAGRALAERPDVDPAEYAARLADDSGRLRQLDLANSSGGVEASFELSYGMLDAEQRSALCALAVFSQPFDRAAAAAIWDLPPAATDARIGALLRFNLIEWDGAGQGARYRLHDLVRLFADARLGAAERELSALRHARHYLGVLQAIDLAARAGGTEQSLSVLDREWVHIRAAFEYCRARAESASDSEAALLASQAPDATILRLRQHPLERTAWCELGARLAHARGDRRLEGRLLGHAARAHQQLGDLTRALEASERSLAIATAEADRETEAYALIGLGDVRHALGEPRPAIAAAERGLALAREQGARSDEASALIVLAWAHHVAGDSERAVEYGEQSLPIARELRDGSLEATALLPLGYALQALGRNQLSVEHATRALDIAREVGDRRIEGYALLITGDRASAQEQIALSLQIAHETGDPRLEGNALLYLALALNQRGAAREALETAERAREIAGATGDRALAGNTLMAIGVAHSALRDLPSAIDALRHGLEVSLAIGNHRLEAMTAFLLGSALEQTGQIEQAIAALERSMAYQVAVGFRGAAQTRARIDAMRAKLARERAAGA